MRLLLDTHAAIWAVARSNLLPPKLREAILRAPDQVHVSAATIFEIATKHKLMREDSPPFGGKDAMVYLRAMGFQFLPIAPEHAAIIDQLEPHHRDPLIALYDCPRRPWE